MNSPEWSFDRVYSKTRLSQIAKELLPTLLTIKGRKENFAEQMARQGVSLE
jgi:hypothetical protein